MIEIYKNDTVIPYTDAGGITNTSNAGESRLGTDFFTGEPLAGVDEVLSTRLVCDRCGNPPPSGSELIKQKGFMLCRRCIDE